MPAHAPGAMVEASLSTSEAFALYAGLCGKQFEAADAVLRARHARLLPVWP